MFEDTLQQYVLEDRTMSLFDETDVWWMGDVVVNFTIIQSDPIYTRVDRKMNSLFYPPLIYIYYVVVNFYNSIQLGYPSLEG